MRKPMKLECIENKAIRKSDHNNEGAFVELLNQEMKELQNNMKQKQIDEIQAVLSNIEVVKAMYGDFDLARLLYDRGVRKIFNSAVVLTREDYESIRNAELNLDWEVDKKVAEELDRVDKEACKETAEKFAEYLLYEYISFDDNTLISVGTLRENIKSILEKRFQ